MKILPLCNHGWSKILLQRGLEMDSDWLDEIYHRHDRYSFIQHFIMEQNQTSFGFAQYYDCNKISEEDHAAEPTGTYGIDYAIGDRRFIGKGPGKDTVRLICDKVI